MLEQWWHKTSKNNHPVTDLTYSLFNQMEPSIIWVTENMVLDSPRI